MRYWILLAFLTSFVYNGLAQDDTCPSDFAEYLSPRLIIGEEARVVLDMELNIRATPSTQEARIGALRGGTHVSVLAEPRCAENYVWWQVEYGEGIGWVAEGSGEDYYLEPRGELVLIEDENGVAEPYIRTASGFVEPQGCMLPPDDYTLVNIDFATLNARTLFMLDNAQFIYEQNGGDWAIFRNLITQGSYNEGVVEASFGTHDGGGAIDIAVRDATQDFRVMEEEIMPMLKALRIAGFAAWLRDTGELYPNSPVHIHAIAIGDEEASEIARQQVDSDFGYFSGFNGLPPEEGQAPNPDLYGAPILCEWMVDLGFADRR
jgi:hypothetical protein